MSAEWRNSTLGKFVRLQRGHDLTASEQQPGGIPIMGSAGPNGTHSTALAKGPGVVVGRSGASAGRVHFSAVDYWPHNTCLYVTDFLGNSPRFAYYLLQTVDLASFNSGSAQPSLNRNFLYAIPVKIPTRMEQDGIVALLQSLDDRITLLRETNATLEAIAQALFKSWFVDFDPARAKLEGRAPEGMDEATARLFPDSFEESELGLLPRGWAMRTMADVSTVGIGKTPPRKEQHWFSEAPSDVRWVSIRDMGAIGVYAARTSEFLTQEAVDKFNVRQVPDNTVLMSFKMTIGRVAITDGEMTTNEAIAHFKLALDAPLTTEYIYLHLKQFDFSTLSSTSSIADAVNSKTVREIPILVPTPDVMAVFHSQVGGLFAKLKNTEQQAQTLATLRDTLLPRLISGQLRLPEVEAHIEDVTT
jgi:type I restriction enzyme S subunit